MSNPNWIVLCPAYSHVCPDVEQNLGALEAAGVPVLRRIGGSDIVRERGILASHVLRSLPSVDRVLWVDADQVFSAEDAIRMLAGPHDWLTALAPTRRAGGQRRLLVDLDFPPELEHVRAALPNPIILGENSSPPFRVWRAGFGAMVTSRALLEAVANMVGWVDGDTWSPMFLPTLRASTRDTTRGVEYVSEDYSFCERAWALGWELWADPSVRVGHIGPFTYQWEHALTDLLSHRARSIQVNVGG